MIESNALHEAFAPLIRESLSDRLVTRIRTSIENGRYRDGDRLPTIDQMAAAFRVGSSTVREALTKLEMMRVVEVRHGLGVFVVDASPTGELSAHGTASR